MIKVINKKDNIYELSEELDPLSTLVRSDFKFGEECEIYIIESREGNKHKIFEDKELNPNIEYLLLASKPITEYDENYKKDS